MKNDADNEKQEALDMKEQITQLQQANVKGALNLTKVAHAKSEDAKQRVELVMRDSLAESEKRRKTTYGLMETNGQQYDETHQSNKQTLADIVDQISNLEKKIPELNAKVCDGETSVNDPCDSLCGGAGCGKCGGISCLKGALSKAEEAVKSAKTADNILAEKDLKAQQVLLQISDAHSKAQNAANDAQRARDQAFEAKNMSVVELERASGIASRIDEFTSEGKASPEDVETLAQEVSFQKFRETK